LKYLGFRDFISKAGGVMLFHSATPFSLSKRKNTVNILGIIAKIEGVLKACQVKNS